jgi:hypothetical protein
LVPRSQRIHKGEASLQERFLLARSKKGMSF